MTALDAVQLMIGAGVFAQGAAALHWAMNIEKRVTILEAKA